MAGTQLVMAEQEQLWARLSAIEGRISAIEQQQAKLAAQLDGYAPVKMVHDMLTPLRETTIRMEMSLKQLSEQVGTVFKLHEEVMRERADMERRLHDEKVAALKQDSLWFVLKEKWLPLLALASALYAVLAYVQHLIAKLPVK